MLYASVPSYLVCPLVAVELYLLLWPVLLLGGEGFVQVEKALGGALL